MAYQTGRSIYERFLAFGESDFCDWLSRGFKDFYSKQVGPKPTGGAISLPRSDNAQPHETLVRPFDFASSLIGRRESLLDDIEFIYKQHVPEEKKILFRLSIGRLFRQCASDVAFPEPAVSDLIYLMVKVKAYESLESIAPVIGRGKYGQDRGWLQYEAIATFKALLPAKEAINSLRDLATLPNFSIGYSFEVLTGLCRAEPARWSSAFLFMTRHIADLRRLATQEGDKALAEVEHEASRIARIFAESMPTNSIAEQLPQIELTLSSEALYTSGTWLVKELFMVDNPPMFAEKESFKSTGPEVEVPVVVVKNPSRRATIKWDPIQYRIFQDLKWEADMRKLRSIQPTGQTSTVINPLAAPAIFLNLSNILPKRSQCLLGRT